MNSKTRVIFSLLLSLILGCSSSRNQSSTGKDQHVKRQSKKRDSNKVAKAVESIIDYQIDQKERKRQGHPAKKGWPPKHKK
ncbi:MAG: hypothetical protein ACQUHE_09725 [Bacteroidia bacterium]